MSEFLEGFKKAVGNIFARLSGKYLTRQDLRRGLSFTLEKETKTLKLMLGKEPILKNKNTRGAFIELQKELLAAKKGTEKLINKTFARMDKAGESSVLSAQKELKKAFEEQGIFKVRFANNANVDYGKYADMVVRTARNETANAEHISRALKEGSDLVKCLGNSVTCGVCSQYRDKVFSISGKDKRFPALYDGANAPLRHGYKTIHPNCRCEFLPYYEELKTNDELRSDLARSRQPMTDSRTQSQKEKYSNWQANNRQLNAESAEFAKMQKFLGNKSHYKTIKGFRAAKRKESPQYLENKFEMEVFAEIEKRVGDYKYTVFENAYQIPREYKERAKALDEKHKDAVRYYSEWEKGVNLNTKIGKGIPLTPKEQEFSDDLTNALNEMSLDKDTLLFRGAKKETIAEWDKLSKIEIWKWKGEEITLKSFASTSLLLKNSYDINKPIKMIFLEKKGQKGAGYINEISYNKLNGLELEYEVLLQKNQRYVIINAIRIKDKYVIVLSRGENEKGSV